MKAACMYFATPAESEHTFMCTIDRHSHFAEKDVAIGRSRADSLTSAGKAQAEEMARRIKSLEQIITSPSGCCVETAIVVANMHNVPVFVDYGLCGSVDKNRLESLGLEDLQIRAKQLATGDKVSLKLHQPALITGSTKTDRQKCALDISKALIDRASQFVNTLIISHRNMLLHTVSHLVHQQDVGVLGYCSLCQVQFVGINAAHTTTSQKYYATLSELFRPPTKYSEKQDWCSQYDSKWRLLIAAGTHVQPIRALEIGNWEGFSTSWFLGNICRHPKSELWCVDHFDRCEGDPGLNRLRLFLYNIRSTGSIHKSRMIPRFSFNALHMLLAVGNNFDFVYIDGSHRSDDTFLDAELSWRMLKKGGKLLFDDYEWPLKSPENPYGADSVDSVEHPKNGIDSFLKIHSGEIRILHKEYQVLIEKTSDVRMGFPMNVSWKPTFISMQQYIDPKQDEKLLENIVRICRSEDDAVLDFSS